MVRGRKQIPVSELPESEKKYTKEVKKPDGTRYLYDYKLVNKRVVKRGTAIQKVANR